MKKIIPSLLIILLAACSKSTVIPVTPNNPAPAGIVTPAIPVAQNAPTDSATNPAPALTSFDVYSVQDSVTIHISNISFSSQGILTCTATAPKSGTVFMNFVVSPGGVRSNMVMDYGCILTFAPSGSNDMVTAAAAGYIEVVNITSL